jgi:hypothetical protein
MSDLPVALPAELEPAFVAAFDPPGKLAAALDSLGPVAGRDVLVVDAESGPVLRGLAATGARIATQAARRPFRLDAEDGSVDAVIGLWSAFRGVDATEQVEVDRVLRPGGRHLIVHDYGRDDVSRLFPPDRPEYGEWSHRFGPFLKGAYRVRVVHCFWEFDSQEAVASFLGRAFGASGETLAATLKRPRLSHNVAVYHRSRP